MTSPDSPCPKCGGELEAGYGLMGGGCGPYVFCIADACEFFEKEQDPDCDPAEECRVFGAVLGTPK